MTFAEIEETQYTTVQLMESIMKENLQNKNSRIDETRKIV